MCKYKFVNCSLQSDILQLQAGEYVDESIRAIQSSQEDQKLYYTNIKTKGAQYTVYLNAAVRARVRACVCVLPAN